MLYPIWPRVREGEKDDLGYSRAEEGCLGLELRKIDWGLNTLGIELIVLSGILGDGLAPKQLLCATRKKIFTYPDLVHIIE